MAYVLFLVGLISALLGGYMTFSVFGGVDRSMAETHALALIGAATPGLTLFVIGILLLAAGEALVRLADIARNTARTARAAEQSATLAARSERTPSVANRAGPTQ